MQLSLTLFVLLCIFLGSYLAYFFYFWKKAKNPWKLRFEENFQPKITILVPAHNEEKVIQARLQNLIEVLYPKDKLEIIVIDDASTDETDVKVRKFIEKHPEVNIKFLKQNSRRGKTEALNLGLNFSSGDIIIIADADSIWPPNLLLKAMPYMSDPSVGAITGRSLPLNDHMTWLVRTERNYIHIMDVVRIGESKIHSTIRFGGCFGAFKRSAFDKFDSKSGADDSGTALMVVQNGLRAILIPEAVAFSEVPLTFEKRIKAKVRRAIHLNNLWLFCLKLLIRGKLKLPKNIALFEIFISIFNPFLFILLFISILHLLILYPVFFLLLVISFYSLLLLPKLRDYVMTCVLNGVIDHFILVWATIFNLLGKKIHVWD